METKRCTNVNPTPALSVNSSFQKLADATMKTYTYNTLNKTENTIKKMRLTIAKEEKLVASGEYKK